MHTGNVTTPFGRRPAKLAFVQRQLETGASPEDKTANKWRVYRDVCEARTLLGVQDRALAVLNALLTFHPGTDLGESGLVVFPSNAQLSVRAHGISGATLRRALAALVEAGLIERRDSPNGKRYAHRDRAGEVEQAFGFSLAPLLARSEELALLAGKVAEEARRFRKAREALTICRRDVRKLITAAMEEGVEGDWEAVEKVYQGVAGELPRNPRRLQVESALEKMALLRAEVINLLEKQFKSQNISASDDQDERHIQSSNTESNIESEPLYEEARGGAVEPQTGPDQRPPPIFPLATVLTACPGVVDYGPDGTVKSWQDFLSAAAIVRSMLGISPSAYDEACEAMGHQNAAVTIACILERQEHITSAGGYLRDLTSRARAGGFSPGPALMALLKSNAATRTMTADHGAGAIPAWLQSGARWKPAASLRPGATVSSRGGDVR